MVQAQVVLVAIGCRRSVPPIACSVKPISNAEIIWRRHQAEELRHRSTRIHGRTIPVKAKNIDGLKTSGGGGGSDRIPIKIHCGNRAKDVGIQDTWKVAEDAL